MPLVEKFEGGVLDISIIIIIKSSQILLLFIIKLLLILLSSIPSNRKLLLQNSADALNPLTRIAAECLPAGVRCLRINATR
jgi:hypothetical protein